MSLCLRVLLIAMIVSGCSQQPPSSTPSPSTSAVNPPANSPAIQPQQQPRETSTLSTPGELTPSATTSRWESVLDRIDPQRDAVSGKWTQTNEGLHVSAASGASLSVPVTLPSEYDVRIIFTRQTGKDSIALFFPLGSGQGGFEVDAWGEHLGGIQNIAGRSIRENSTRQANVTLTNHQRYTMTLEVRIGQVRALLEDKVIATHRTDGSDLALPQLWALPDRQRLGIGAWDSETLFHAIDLRTVSGTPRHMANSPATPIISPSQPSPQPVQTTPPATPPTAVNGAVRSAAGKRVLLVIANYHFFYREYADPRAEMERAGITVTVAAGRKAQCVPHSNSGEGADRGIVQPDIAIADAQAADYDAILFSGGWGSSAYQFAFDGRYNDAQYNGDRNTKVAVNRLIGDFITQDKYVCALCNAVSVPAWARINGQSPLRGKNVCAPTRQAAPGIYNGKNDQPSCRWHPETNGAILSPAGSIGRPGTAEDDVIVDGKFVTGEDDISAREMGRRIVQLLSN